MPRDLHPETGHELKRLIDSVVQPLGPALIQVPEAEWSGFYGAKDGQLEIIADLAANDTPGPWRIIARELASGLEGNAYVEVGR